ncbi:unnamed protein product [Effrenium voratum]|uniref:Uncharacterized protein n=1 Tax=Effrenium voratum TaxID=2562239 RepID=A0AA36ILU0_9DINO|nr:unnamed protein product [Effrenium voratum]
MIYVGGDLGKRFARGSSVLAVILILTMTTVAIIDFEASNFEPFIPPDMGIAGVLAGSVTTFFGFIGFDEVCCMAGEATNPRKTVPRALIGTLLCATVLPLAASLALVGFTPYTSIDPSSGFAVAFRDRGWTALAYAVQLGQLVVLFVVTYMCFLAQPRVFFALARDGLLPCRFAELNEAGEPWFATLMTGVLVVACGALLPFSTLANAISGGVCVNFNLVNCCMVVLRGGGQSCRLGGSLFGFNGFCLLTALLLRQVLGEDVEGMAHVWALAAASVAALATILCFVAITAYLRDQAASDNEADCGKLAVAVALGLAQGFELKREFVEIPESIVSRRYQMCRESDLSCARSCNMFKKAAAVAFKGETRIRGKEGKRLQEAVAAAHGEDLASVLLPNKADVIVRKAGGGSNLQFIFINSECLFVQLDGKADMGVGELMPTLLALWKVGAEAMLPSVVIQRPVAKFIFGGANVMAPGIHSVLPCKGEVAREGRLVAVRAEGNPGAAAVGRLRMPAASLPGPKGEAVEVLHYFGDAFWEAMGSPRPAGFVGDQIHSTSDTADAISAQPDEAETAAAAEAEAPGEDQSKATESAMVKDLEECLLQVQCVCMNCG